MDSLDPKTLPQGGANVGTVIPLICSCPPKCVCGSKESKKWCHAQCSNPSFISEAGDILCKNHLGACSSYFIKDASFKCEESENYEKYSAAYEFFQVLAQTMQASSYKLDEKDQCKNYVKMVHVIYTSMKYQQYDQKDKQMEQEIQYHVYQDLANVLGLLTDTVQTMNFFGENKNHPYVPIIYEKLKLQMILSNGIHFDIKQTHQKNKNYMDLLFKEKEKALNIFANIIKDQFKDVKDQFISNCIKMYYENILLFNDVKYLNMDENLQQQQPISISDGRFNQQVVQKVLNGMFEVSHYKSLIAKGQYQCLTEVEIREMTLARAELVKQKLSENYPEFAIKAPKVQQQLISNIESDQYSISGQSTEINNPKVQQSSKKYISPNPIPQVHQLDNQNKKQVQEGNFGEKNIPSSGRGKQDKTRETAQPQRTSHDSNKSQKGKSKPLKSAEQQQLINPIQGDTATRMEEESEKLYFPSKISQNLKQFLNSIFIVLSPKWPNEDQKNKYSNQLTLSDEDYNELTRLSGQFNTNFMKHLFQIILDQRFAKDMKTDDQLEKDIEIIQQYIKY